MPHFGLARRSPVPDPKQARGIYARFAKWMTHAASPLLRDLLICLRFGTRLPLPAFSFEPAPHALSEFSRASRMFPLAGGLVGGLGALVLTGAGAIGLSPRVAALCAIATMIVVTGALHEDGLADCADGFGGGSTRARKLEIMRDSVLGTYGTVALVLTLLMRHAALGDVATRSTTAAAMMLIAGAAVSRAAALVPSILLPPARDAGSGHAAGRPRPMAVAVAAGLAVLFGHAPLLAGAAWGGSVLAIMVAAGAACAISASAYRQIGGHTGDVAGAAQQLSELAFYLVHARG